jgi:hypothetical protein
MTDIGVGAAWACVLAWGNTMLPDTLRFLKLEEMSKQERDELMKKLKQHKRDLEAAIKAIDRIVGGTPKRRASKKSAT